MEKKLVRKVTIYNQYPQLPILPGGTTNGVAPIIGMPTNISIFEVGVADVVAINFAGTEGVNIYFRAEDEKVENSTPRKMEERPMKYFHGLPFIVEDVLK